MDNYDKILYNIFLLASSLIIGNATMKSGFAMVGESGVSQEVVNAIIGTIASMVGGYLIVYGIVKATMNCIRLYKNSKNQSVIPN